MYAYDVRYCFTLSEGAGHYQECQALPQKDIARRVRKSARIHGSSPRVERLVQRRLRSHGARERLGRGKSVLVMRMKGPELTQKSAFVAKVINGTGFLKACVVEKIGCCGSRYQLHAAPVWV